MTTERRTATELLAQEHALTLGQAAIVLNLRHTRGACMTTEAPMQFVSRT